MRAKPGNGNFFEDLPRKMGILRKYVDVFVPAQYPIIQFTHHFLRHCHMEFAMTRLTPALLASGAASTLLLSAAWAEPPKLVYTNDNGGTVRFYGQLSPTYLGFDDGEETYNNLVDNTHSNSRVGMKLDQDFANGQSLSFLVEIGLGLPGSGSYTQVGDNQNVWYWDETDIRHIDLSWSTGFGRFSIGQGSMATDGVATHDLSGTTLASTVTTADTAGSYFFRKTDGELSDIALKNVFSDFDGGRKGRIRYDTPKWNGLSLAASYGTDVLQDYGDKTYYDIALRYGEVINDFEYAAGIGYAWVEEDDVDTVETWSGSFALKHLPTGLNGVIATGAKIDGGNYAYGKLGWIGEVWNAGYTAVSADYYSGNDFVTDGSDSAQWGIQATQKFDDAGLEAYIGYAEYSFEDKSGESYQDASSVIGGVRWKF